MNDKELDAKIKVALKDLEKQTVDWIDKEHAAGHISDELHRQLRLIVTLPPEQAEIGLEWLLEHGEWQNHPQAAEVLARLRQSD